MSSLLANRLTSKAYWLSRSALWNPFSDQRAENHLVGLQADLGLRDVFCHGSTFPSLTMPVFAVSPCRGKRPRPNINIRLGRRTSRAFRSATGRTDTFAMFRTLLKRFGSWPRPPPAATLRLSKRLEDRRHLPGLRLIERELVDDHNLVVLDFRRHRHPRRHDRLLRQAVRQRRGRRRKCTPPRRTPLRRWPARALPVPSGDTSSVDPATSPRLFVLVDLGADSPGTSPRHREAIASKLVRQLGRVDFVGTDSSPFRLYTGRLTMVRTSLLLLFSTRTAASRRHAVPLPRPLLAATGTGSLFVGRTIRYPRHLGREPHREPAASCSPRRRARHAGFGRWALPYWPAIRFPLNIREGYARALAAGVPVDL